MGPVPQRKVPERQLCAAFVRANVGLPASPSSQAQPRVGMPPHLMCGQPLRSPFGDLHQSLLCLVAHMSCWETVSIRCTRASAAVITLAQCSAALKGTQPQPQKFFSPSSQFLPSYGVPVLPWLYPPPVCSNLDFSSFPSLLPFSSSPPLPTNIHLTQYFCVLPLGD